MPTEYEPADEAPSWSVPDHIQQRVVFLSRDLNVLEISRLPGMPDVRRLYAAIASDPAFRQGYVKANKQHQRRRRAALADLLRRSQQTDLSRVFIALRKLQRQSLRTERQNSSDYDLTLLSDAEFASLQKILSKAVRDPAKAMLLSDQSKSE